MNLFKNRSRGQRIFTGILCFMLAATGFIGLGSSGTATAAVSSLITSYKPQVVNADANVSYTDSNGKTITGTIHHPGILMSLADLDNMRDHVRAGDEPWSTAFNHYAAQGASSKSLRIFFQPNNDIFIHLRGPWPATVGGVFYSNPQEAFEHPAQWDSENCFKQVIMWYITGDEVYRKNAMTIIRNFELIQSGGGYSSLRTSAITHNLAASAEILRYSDTPTESLKWTDNDTAQLTRVFDIFALNYNLHTFFLNQHQFSVEGGLARAIFKNDLKLYAEAVEATTVNSAGDKGGINGSIKQAMRYMTANELTGEPLDPSDYHVQLIEAGRDMGHAWINVAGLSSLAQTLFIQGTKVDPVNGTMSTAANAVNPYNFLDDRILEGTTYLLKHNLGYDVIFTPCNPWSFSKINGGDRIDAQFLALLYNYYKYIEQQDMTQEKYKYLAYAVETRAPLFANKDYLTATLPFTADAAKQDGTSNWKTLGKVTDLTAKYEGQNAINLSWTAAANALGYNIYKSTSENGTYTKLTSAPIGQTSYTDTEVDPNTTYYYKVGVAGGAKSSTVSLTTLGSGIPFLDSTNYVLNTNYTHVTKLSVVSINGTYQDLTSQATFTSSNPAVATVDSTGLVTYAGPGTTTITANFNGQNYTATVTAIADSSLNAWYKFDENSGTSAADSSGYGNNASLNGGDSLVPGNSGNAVSLNGKDGYVSLPGGIVSSSTTGTVSAWVYLNSASNWMRIFDFGSGTATNMFLTARNGQNSKIRFAIKNNNSAAQIIDGTSALPTGGWHHVAVTLNGATGILYVDGNEVGRNGAMTIKPSDLGATTQNWIGRSQYADPYFNGKVDDFRIYNRALSSVEIANVMNGQTLPPHLPSAPAGLTAAAADNTTINLSWSAVTGTTGYNLYASDSRAVNAVYTKVNSSVIEGTTFVHTGLKANTAYYYKVTAVNEAGESVMSSIVSATTVSSLPDLSLKAWYKLDEASGTKAIDASGYGNNALVNGGGSWDTGYNGGQAVSLDGTNGYVSLPNGIVSGNNTFTIAAWVYLNSTSNWSRIFDFGSGTATTMYLTAQNGQNGKIRFGIKNNSSAEQKIDGTSSLPTGGWHHVGVTLNGATGILYVDGIEVGRNSAMTIKPSDLGSTTQNWIGRSQFNDPYLNGKVDDFRIYNRAINAAEITKVMNGQTLLPSAPAGLTAAAADHTSINLSWPEVTGATGYNLYATDSNVVNAVYTKLNSSVIEGTTFVHTGLKANTAYYYKVTAVNESGESVMSSIVSATTLLDPSLKAWYKLDEASGTTAVDASLYGNTASVNSGGSWAPGNSGNAVSLNGTNGYVSLPAGIVSSNSTCTVSAWVYLNSSRNWTRIFDFGSGTATNMFLTAQNGQNGKIRFAIKNNNSAEQQIDGTSALPTGGWHHVAVTLNGATGILYVDGNEVGRNSAMTIKPSDLGSTKQNWIGRSQYADPYLNGKVDDFRVYDRALSASEVVSVMSGQ
ncbi:LamG-like jellyroll fold domain-containing protein [Paenibacillus sedimenti]|uniref:Fibronectin type III domain-containing protein n=1 Tax=Paenibacillus sedimenti TaxID=2770274 RepID=A0A926QHH0_9BACL|nr:LamG-like jellyroll fold domain-containing protein [Paenibacillus sedimenti]MBD0378508.1 fibronectin type III domain-containing protein [Paenibacillus sedimenti]